MKKLFLMCAVALCGSHMAFAECNTQACDREGITDTEIKIGSAAAFSGPLASYSVILQGMKAAFDKKNSEGGVHGRKINFIYYDHAYSTTKAVEQVKRLIDQDKVFAMVGLFGTPPFLATEPMLKERMIPNINVLSGSTTLIDNPVKHYPSWGLQPSYASYTYGMLTAIAQEHPNAKVAFVYMNNAFGLEYLTYAKKFLPAINKAYNANITIVHEEPVAPTSVNLKPGVIKAKVSGADVVFLGSVTSQVIPAVKEMHGIGWHPTIIVSDVANLSMLYANIQKDMGEEAVRNIVTNQWYEDPTDASVANTEGMKAFKALKNIDPTLDTNNILAALGYLNASQFIDMLEKAGKDVSRSKLMDMLARYQYCHPLFVGGCFEITPNNRAGMGAGFYAKWDTKQKIFAKTAVPLGKMPISLLDQVMYGWQKS